MPLPLIERQEVAIAEIHEESVKPSRQREEYRRGRPAFSSKTKGGIFGFKK